MRRGLVVRGASVLMHAEPCPGYSFDHWELQTGEDQWDPLGTAGWPYLNVTMTEDKIVRAVFGLCGDGRHGGNINRANMVDDFFASRATKAAAWQESSWRQFTCDRTVLMNGNATGLMQIIPSSWPEGYNPELQRDILLGDLCTGDGYRGDETYNKNLGEDIWDLRQGQALEAIGSYNPNTEQLLKETAAKYHGGNGGWYWKRSELQSVPPVWVADSASSDVPHANAVWTHYQAETWTGSLDCPCTE